MPKQATGYYRPDIDGLRAVAILPVLFFHAKFGCPGGFVGVDIFFVISGFVISSLILRELNHGTFSLISFWERRIRRILPALVVVILATLIAGWFLFLPAAFAMLGKSVVAQETLISNLYFYREWLNGTGYFTPAIDPQPLLHTWSLAVEEQFYLFFPIVLTCLPRDRRPPLAGTLVSLAIGWLMLSIYSFCYYYPSADFFLPAATWKFMFCALLLLFAYPLLMCLTRFRRPAFTETIAGIAAASFVLSIYGGYYFPAATFYLLPTRAWELLLGVLLVLMRGRFAAGGRTSEIAGWFGFALIGGAIFFYQLNAAFPNGAAIPACLGAALIIFSSELKLSGIGRILALKPLVFIGLISYSLYLWHWPLLVFSQYPFNHESAGPRAAMLAAAGVLAVLSWKYVETPFRKASLLQKRPHLFGAAGISIATLLLFAIFVIQTSGMPSRFSGKARVYIDNHSHTAFRNGVDLVNALAGRFPEIGSHATNQPVNLVVWGDSHAMAVTPVLDELCRKHSWRGIQAAQNSNLTGPAFFSIKPQAPGPLDKSPPAFTEAVLDYITKQHVKNVVIAGFWTKYPGALEIKTDLPSTVRAVLKLGARVYVLKDVPRQDPDFSSQIEYVVLHGGDLYQIGVTAEQYQEASRELDPMFAEISSMGATVLDPAGYFLNSKGIYGVFKDGQFLYDDSNHLTVEGSEFLAPLFEPIFTMNRP